MGLVVGGGDMGCEMRNAGEGKRLPEALRRLMNRLTLYFL